MYSAYERSGAAVPASAAKVLHLGCGVGGVTFALSRHFGKVVAVDKSMTYIRHARIMQHHGQQEYEKVRPRVGVRAFLPTNDPHQCH